MKEAVLYTHGTQWRKVLGQLSIYMEKDYFDSVLDAGRPSQISFSG